MGIEIIAGPLIGAVIGYCTNYIAVKMLFRPLKPVKVFGKTLPFTPGIIPKRKDQLAESVGDAIVNNLLTEEALEKSLLSREILDKLHDKINIKIADMEKDDRMIHDVITYYVNEDELQNSIDKAENFAAEKLCQKVIEMDIGKMIADEAVEGIKENSLGSLMSKFLSDDMLYSMVTPIANKIDAMVKTKGIDMVKNKIHSEFENFENKTVGDIFAAINQSGTDVGQIIVTCYSLLIRKKLTSMLKSIDISKIIKDKIDSMDALEMEKLVLSVMKKELNAIVSLGALIGFILGCVNIFV